MDERLVTDLETAIADTGALLVRVQKYRRGAGDEGAALLRAALALGDAARRLGRLDALADDAVARLRADADALAGRIGALLADVRASAPYRAAVRAHAAGDQAALAAVVPTLFDDVEPMAVVPDLHHALAWRRRNRPRPAAELAAEVARLRADGLAAEGDDLTPGADAELPAVVLSVDVPPDEPLVLQVPAGSLLAPAYRLADTGEVLVYVPRLHVPFVVVLAAELAPDALESAADDWARWRDALAAALRTAAIPFVAA